MRSIVQTEDKVMGKITQLFCPEVLIKAFLLEGEMR
jgi:hypothetical protein